MKVEMVLGLKDKPGTLLSSLKPISSHGGNILSVVHTRNKGDRVEVIVSFKVMDNESLDLIKRELMKIKVHVAEIIVEGKQYYAKKTMSFILVGHVVDTDVRDTIDRINAVGLVSDLDVVMPDPDEKSSVMMRVDVDGKRLDKLIEEIERVCEEKNFLLISSLD